LIDRLSKTTLKKKKKKNNNKYRKYPTQANVERETERLAGTGEKT
jgi:hypothetical protein